jgi:hypothetical protein
VANRIKRIEINSIEKILGLKYKGKTEVFVDSPRPRLEAVLSHTSKIRSGITSFLKNRSCANFIGKLRSNPCAVHRLVRFCKTPWCNSESIWVMKNFMIAIIGVWQWKRQTRASFCSRIAGIQTQKLDQTGLKGIMVL